MNVAACDGADEYRSLHQSPECLAGCAKRLRVSSIDFGVYPEEDGREPAPHRLYADLHVDIPHALVRVPDLAG